MADPVDSARAALEIQKEAIDLVHSEVEERRDNVQIAIREMFANLRVAVKRRQRYMLRRADVVVELKRERLTAEFEELYNASETVEELLESTDPETVADFIQKANVHITRQTAVTAMVDSNLKEQFQSFGSVKRSPHHSLSPFIICACALEDPQLISEGLALLADVKLTAKSPGVSIDEVEGVIDVLKSYAGPIAASSDFPAPTLARSAASGLANLAAVGSDYWRAAGAQGGVQLFLGWLEHISDDEHTVGAICSYLAEVCHDDGNLNEFLKLDGIPAVMKILSIHGKVPARFENALQVIVTLCMSSNEDARKQLIAANAIQLLIQVMAAHKRSNSATVHQNGATALHWLLQNDTPKGKHRTQMMESGVSSVLLSCLMPRVTTAPSAEIIGDLLVALLHTAPEGDTLASEIMDGLPKISFVMSEYIELASTQRVYMDVIAGLCTSSKNKAAIVEAELIECVVSGMLKHPDDVRMQEQACRTLCDVSRGEESVKDYMADVLEDSFHHGFNLIEIILEGVSNFVEDLDFVEAACSASWSVAFKNAKMKTKAAEAGVFDIMSKVIQVHTNEPDVLPHCFAAISNLVANHEPNQVVAGSGGVIKAAIECLTIYQNHSMMCLTILTTLKSIMVGQQDNMDKFEDEHGVKLVAEIKENFADPQDEVEESILELTDALCNIIDDRKDEIEAKKKKADAGKIPMVEYKELQDNPLKALMDEEKTTVVKKGMLMVQHKNQKEPTLQLCILYKHELVCFDDPEYSKTMRPLETYHLALFTSLNLNAADKTEFSFDTLNKRQAILRGSTVAEAEVWLEALSALQPDKTSHVQAVDPKKSQPRFIALQSDVFFTFGEVKKVWTVKRAFMTKCLSDISSKGKHFSLKEAMHDDTWVFACKSSQDSSEWEAFLSERVQVMLDKLERDAAEAAQKKASQEITGLQNTELQERITAEAAWYDEEADRRLIEMMAQDDSIEDEERVKEYTRMEQQAAAEEEIRKKEQAARAAKETARREREEARRQATSDTADRKSLRDYIDALKKEIADTQTELNSLIEQNAPMKKQLDEAKKEYSDTHQDYIDMKKEFDKLLGGRLGQILGDYDMEAMERNKKATQTFVDDEEDQARQQKSVMKLSAAARATGAAVGSLKAANAHCF